MRFLTVKFASFASAIALAVAHTSSVACVWFIFQETKMPESLYIKD